MVCFGSRVFTSLSGLSIGKAGQLPYPSSESVFPRPFDLVHSDVWGSAPFVYKDDHKYCIIFIDDFSRHTWIYFMKHRSEALFIYKTFSAMIHTHFDTSIRVFCADFIEEYLSDALRQVLMLRMELLSASIGMYLRLLESVSTTTYLINI
jgi:hypothetical protein